LNLATGKTKGIFSGKGSACSYERVAEAD